MDTVCKIGPSAQRPCILVIEDSEATLQMYEYFLPREGWDTLLESNPISALETFRREMARISIVLTDGDLPEASGLWLAERIRELSPVPIVLVSADVLKFREEDHLSVFTEYVEKPFEAAELWATLKRCAAQGRFGEG